MKYLLEDFMLTGIPQTALPGGLASRGIAGHWTAGRPGREGARATARDFAARPERNASYHEIWWWHALAREFGVLRIVPPTSAAHSMNPAPPSWSPNSLVREILGDRVWDPNAVSYAVAFAGMPADLAAAMKDRWFVLCAARRIRELLVQETTITHPRPLFNHGEGQPSTRYDWGTELRPAIYRELYGAAEPQEDEMITWRAVEEDWDTANGSVFWDGEGERKEFTGVHRVHSVAESTDGVYRLLDWGNGSEYLVALRKGLKAVPGTRNPASGYGVVRPDQQHIVDEATAELREQLADQAEALNAAHRRIEAARAALTG